jgi:hypothetical protein
MAESALKPRRRERHGADRRLPDVAEVVLNASDGLEVRPGNLCGREFQ